MPFKLSTRLLVTQVVTCAVALVGCWNSSTKTSKEKTTGTYETLWNAVVDCDRSAAADALNNGANPNGHKTGEISLLQYAVMCCDIEMSELLLEHGANINYQNDMDVSPLFGAIYYRKKEQARLLIKYGANVNLPNLLGTSPLVMAITRGHFKTSLQLEQGMRGLRNLEIDNDRIRILSQAV